MNKKYIPKDAAPVSAAQWVGDDPDKVAEFLKMLIDHNFRFCFESLYEESEVNVDIHRQQDGDKPTFITTIDHWVWLVIHSNGRLEEMSDAAFNIKYREV